MMTYDELLIQKNKLVQDYNTLLSRGVKQEELAPPAKMAAFLEREIANRHIASGDVQRAIPNLISSASLLASAGATKQAITIYEETLLLVNRRGTAEWIQLQLETLRQRPE